MATISRNSLAGAGCIILFGLPFFGIGSMLVLGAIVSSSGVLSTIRHHTVPARIERVELGPGTGDDQVIKVRYSYELDGARHEGETIGPDQNSASASKHPERFDELERHRATGEPIPLLVDPKNADSSLLFRDLDEGDAMVPAIGLAFASAGAGVLLLGFSSIRGALYRRSRRSKFPDQPWKWEREWDELRVSSSGGCGVVVLWLVVGFLACFLTPFVSAFIVFAKDDDLFPKLLIGVFGLVLVGALIYAIYRTIRFFRYGTPTLLLSQLPIVRGEKIDALVTLNAELVQPKLKARLFLQETVTVRSGSGSKSTTSTRTAWEEALEISADSVRRSGRTTGVPVSFTVPTTEPVTTDEGNPRYEWRLTVVAETEGVDFSETFTLPVFSPDRPDFVEKRVAGFPL